jgi:hypothetical protein
MLAAANMYAGVALLWWKIKMLLSKRISGCVGAG